MQFGGLSAVKSAMADAGLKAGCFLCFVHAPQMTAEGVADLESPLDCIREDLAAIRRFW